jgi:peptide/nickel transport system permease protein
MSNKKSKNILKIILAPIGEFLHKRPLFSFVLRRLIAIIPILIVMSFITYFIFDLMPGDPLSEMRFNPQFDQEDIARYEKKFGLNEPFMVRYWKWFYNVFFRFDLGTSFTYKTDISYLMASRLPATISLNILALIFTELIGLGLGILSAVYNGRWPDRLITVIAILLWSIPIFVFCYLMQIFAISTGWFPTSGAKSANYNELDFFGQLGNELYHLVLPVASQVLGGIAGTIRFMRNQELNELNQPYILTLRAKGMKESTIILKHALRNALNPFITGFGYILASLIGGSLLTEIVFSYPGIGRLTFEALNKRDVYLVMADFLMAGALTLVGITISDILLAITDPRIRMS